MNERSYPGVTSCKVVCMGAAGLGYVLTLILSWGHVAVGEQWGGAGLKDAAVYLIILSGWKAPLAYRGQDVK